MKNLGELLEQTGVKVLELGEKTKKAEIQRSIAELADEKLAELKSKNKALQEAITSEITEPTSKKNVAGITTDTPNQIKIKEYEKSILENQKEITALEIKKEKMILGEIGVLYNRKKWTKKLTKEMKKIREIKKYLGKHSLPYVAVIPDSFIEIMVQTFNMFHFRAKDFTEDGFLIIPEIKIPKTKYNTVQVGPYSHKMLIDKRSVAEAYQGRISRCLTNYECHECPIRRCRITLENMGRGIMHIEAKFKKSAEAKSRNFKNNCYQIKINLPKPPKDVQEKINRWALKCNPREIFTIAAEEAVDVKPVTYPYDPICGYDLRGIKKSFRGYSALIVQYGPDMDEQRITQLAESYYSGRLCPYMAQKYN